MYLICTLIVGIFSCEHIFTNSSSSATCDFTIITAINKRVYYLLNLVFTINKEKRNETNESNFPKGYTKGLFRKSCCSHLLVEYIVGMILLYVHV